MCVCVGGVVCVCLCVCVRNGNFSYIVPLLNGNKRLIFMSQQYGLLHWKKYWSAVLNKEVSFSFLILWSVVSSFTSAKHMWRFCTRASSGFEYEQSLQYMCTQQYSQQPILGQYFCLKWMGHAKFAFILTDMFLHRQPLLICSTGSGDSYWETCDWSAPSAVRTEICGIGKKSFFLYGNAEWQWSVVSCYENPKSIRYHWSLSQNVLYKQPQPNMCIF